MTARQKGGKDLRARAEATLKAKGLSKPPETMTAEAARQLVHELRVHQIELEIQNEELRRTQAEIETTRARYFDLYDLAPVGYCTLDEKGLIVEANLTAATVLGVERRALIGQSIHSFIAREDHDLFYLRGRSLAESGEPESFDLRMVKGDGAPFWAHLTARLGEGDVGQPVLRVALGNETMRMETEAALRASEARTQALISAIPDLIFTNRRSGEFISAQASDPGQLLVPVERLLGRKIEEVLPQPTAGVLMQALTKTLESNSMQQVTYTLSLDGRERRCEARMVPSDRDTVVSIVRDITERKVAEEALASSLREKEALLKEVHHRVKNNLQVITSLLRLETARSKEPDSRRILKDMQGRVISMALLHETLYKTGHFGRVDLARYLEQLARQLLRASQTTAGQAELVLNLAPAEVQIDHAVPFGLILNELLTNSLKHAFAEGRTGEVRVTLRQEPGGPLHLQVRDNGAGLPADFEALRGHSLGLQLVTDLARQLGGRLDIGPAPSAIFTVTANLPPAPMTGPILRPPKEHPK